MEQIVSSVQEKLKGKSRWLLKIAKISKWLLILGCCMEVLLLISYLIFPQWISEFFLATAAEEKRIVPKEVAAITYDEVFHVQAFFQYVLLELISLILVLMIVQYVIVIFRTISSQYTPFTKAVADKLKAMSVVILIYQIYSALFFGQSLFLGLILGFAVYCIALVFEYGSELQELSDETL